MKIKFKDIANYVAGQSPESKYYSITDGVPFLQGNRTFGMFYPTIDSYTTKVTKIAPKGSVLMSVRAPVGDLNFAHEDICIGRGLSSITAKDGDNDFLFYALKYNIQNLIRQSNGTTFDSVTRDVIEQMDMIIPDNKESYKPIKEFLYNLDKKIDINNRINDNLQQLLMEAFVQQFECFANCNKQLKYDKDLKKNIPIDWNATQIGSLASIESGYPFNSDNYSPIGQYKLITIKNVQDSGIDVDTGDRINIVPSDLPDYCKLKSKDILLSLTGNVGRVGLMFTDNCLLNQRVANITPFDESLRPYLFCLFKSQTLRITMERISGGTSQKNLSPIETGNLYIPFNYDIAKQFSIKTDPIISKYVECLKENLKLTQLRNELLPLLMNGQVSIV